MPVNQNNAYYQGPVLLDNAQITPRIVSADVSLPSTPFDFQDARTLFAQINSHELYITALAGANNDLAFIARTPGTSPTVKIAFVDPSANDAALSVTVSGSDITVNLATGPAGAITSTAAQVKAAIEAKAEANALVVVENAPSNDGTGVVTALAQQTLGGPIGTTPTLDVSLKHGLDADTLVTHGTTFTQLTAAGTELKVFTDVAVKGQWVLNIGADADERFAVSLVAKYRP